MDLPTVLLRDLLHLTSSIGIDDDAIGAPLDALVANLRVAVPSYRGLCLTVVEGGHPVTLASFLSGQDGDAISTSLRVPLAALGPGFNLDSRIVFYAATPGAFVDLAADLGHALQAPTTQGRRPSPAADSDGDGQHSTHRDGYRPIVLDADLPPPTLVSGLTGLDEVSTINRAVGMLLDQGHNLDRAHATLRRHASAAGQATHIYAAQLLRR